MENLQNIDMRDPLQMKLKSESDDLTLLDVKYHRSQKTDDNKWSKDNINIVWMDNVSKKKHNKTIYNPLYLYYLSPEELPYAHLFIEKDKVQPIVCKYKDLEKDIATRLGFLDVYYDNIRNGNGRANRLVHTNTRVFNSDMNIENHYRMIFDRMYKNEIQSCSKAYIDIEVDAKYSIDFIPEPGSCPINCVSVLFESVNTEYTYILRDKNNPLVSQFEDYLHSNDFVGEFNELLTSTVGGWKNLHRFGLHNLSHKIIFYDDEVEMLKAIFRTINIIQPDFLLAWNMAFDIPFIIERFKHFGLNPEDYMCHPDFKEKYVYYFIDENHKSEIEKRGDYADISSYTVYLDQMIHFGSRRKGQAAFPSYKLDEIGNIVAKVRKLSYHHITNNLTELPYLDFKTFTMYNMIDVIVQKCIEAKTEDIDYVYNKSIMNSTRYSKIHRQTVYLANRAAMFFYDLGFIIGNNANKFNEKPTTKYPGAFVADPTFVTDTYKFRFKNNPSIPPINVFKNADDYDYKALYPCTIRESNMAPNTQIGMINIPDKIYDKENWRNTPRFNRSTVYIENLASQNYIEFCHRWFGLADYREILEDIKEFYSTKKRSSLPLNIYYGKQGLLDVVEKTEAPISPVHRVGNKLHVVTRYNAVKDVNKLLEGIKYV